jgi:hypothetical protein
MCQKAVIKFTDDEGSKQRLTAYFTDELGTNSNHFDTKQFAEIDGFMLEFEMHTPQFTMTFTATTIEKGGVSKKDFEIPEGFETKTREEVEAIFGGM